MQPHSITAMAVAKHMFADKYGEVIPKGADVTVTWVDTEKKSHTLYHYVSGIEITKKDKNGYITQVRIPVKTSKGDPCTLTITRITDGPFKQGEKVIATHSVHHVSGLEEHYELSRRSIRGFHRRSWKYGDYKSSNAYEGGITLTCKVRVGNTDRFMEIPYTIKVKVVGEEKVKEIAEREGKELAQREEQERLEREGRDGVQNNEKKDSRLQANV